MIKHVCLALLVAVIAISCSNFNLERVPGQTINATSVGGFCTFNPESSIAYTNFLFVIDYSGSNSSEGTDPKKRRIDKAYEFYTANKMTNYMRWGILTFDSDAEAIINDGNRNNPIFTDDETIVENAFNTLRRKGHGGSTNYADAIDLTGSAIAKNNAIDPGQKNLYAVFFITDGEPNVGNPQDTNGLVTKVGQLIAPGDIYFSAAFYGRKSASAEDRIRRMAEAGHGKFANFDKGENVNFNDLIVGGETIEAWILKKDTFFVYNLNSAICEDQRYDVDSDADGMCDRDEVTYNLDPLNRSTPQKDKDGNLYDTGYSDYIYYLTVMKGKRELPKCDEKGRLDADMDLLNDCEEAILSNLSPSGTEWPKGNVWTSGNPVDPDTDNDGVIDGLEAMVFRNHLGWAMDDRINQVWDGDKEIAFRQIQLHRNPLENDAGTAFEYDTKIDLQSDITDGRACYNFKQDKLKLYPVQAVEKTHPLLRHGANENVILVYFIQTKFKDPNGKGIYMSSFQILDANAEEQSSMGSAAGLKVENKMFTPYEVYKKVGKFE